MNDAPKHSTVGNESFLLCDVSSIFNVLFQIITKHHGDTQDMMTKQSEAEVYMSILMLFLSAVYFWGLYVTVMREWQREDQSRTLLFI